MSITTIVWATFVVAMLLALAIGYVLPRRRLRRRFGPEYEHDLTERDHRGEVEPRAPEKRFAALEIAPLTPASRQSYAERWAALQERFVDAPAPAVIAADELVTAAMAERGYPTEDVQQELADLSVVHRRTLHHYRQAHEISARTAPGEASTEDLRQAMVHYRVLFEELLDFDERIDAPVDKHESDDDVRDRWRDLQTSFADDPRDAVQGADRDLMHRPLPPADEQAEECRVLPPTQHRTQRNE